MQALLTDLYANAAAPLVSALLLGLLMAIAPCPLTINITAMGYIGKDLGRPGRIFSNGVFYALGTVLAYTAMQNRNVAIELMVSHLPPRAQAVPARRPSSIQYSAAPALLRPAELQQRRPSPRKKVANAAGRRRRARTR